ncbi:hypothetical protein [Oceanispirochaeta sp. M2]|uniref:hypothetical protein n=1 Tax=Oceanispirochaeta sp. M2 TaxID=2735869 RepID=UPI0018AA16EB|nr:hypothetical protein [Oceanispirochaeta sp. M2]NPD73041.1 hypothetical protein [Oceanispirochaeta sp. M1]
MENPIREFMKHRIEVLALDFPDENPPIDENATELTPIDYSWSNASFLLNHASWEI